MPLPKPSIICTRKLINHQPKISPIVAMKVVHGRNIFCIFFFFYSVLVYKERLNMFIKPGFIPTSYAICRMVILKHIDVQDNIDNTFQNWNIRFDLYSKKLFTNLDTVDKFATHYDRLRFGVDDSFHSINV